MTDEAALSRLLGSKNYRDLCPDTVRREFERQLTRQPDAARAEKAARERLHALSPAFMPPGEIKAARACLKAYAEGDEGALNRTLMLHASTRERLPVCAELYARLREECGEIASVFDAACGINPLLLGSLGFSDVLGWDINGAAAALVNDWAAAAGWRVRAECRDVTLSLPDGRFDLMLAMKLLPVLETNEKGSAMALLRGVDARLFLVTFPTRSLCGRAGGMEKSYSTWFESALTDEFVIRSRFLVGSELCYLVEKAR